MRTTLNIDEVLIRRASQLTGIEEKTALVRMGLEALIARESGQRLALGNGTLETREYDGRYVPEAIVLDSSRPRRWDYTTDGVGNILEILTQIGCLESDLVLANQTITGTEVFESCAGIQAGPAFTVEPGGSATFTAGTRVALNDGFAVQSGGSFVAGTDPSLAGQVETRTYDYQDFQYFLTGGDGPWGSLAWSYDRIGNRLTETRDGVTDIYTYVTNGAAGNTAVLDQITLGIGGTRDYQFGTAGHLERVTASANQVLFASDDEGRLADLSRPVASEAVDVLYDGRSFMQSTVDPATGALTEPTYSSEGLLQALRRQETPASPEQRFTYLYFAGRPVAQFELDGLGGQTLLYLITDHLGTPQVALDDTGAEVWDAAFEPFGRDAEEATPNGALSNGVFLRFPGQWEDGRWGEASFGLETFYNVHRWYQARTGSYSRPDPLALNTSISFAGPSASGDRTIEPIYGYAQMSPLLRLDPLGLKSRVCCRKIPWIPASHCFIQIDRQGKTTTCGLHGGRFSEGEEAGVGQIRGPNDFDDSKESDCGPWNEECGTDECVIETASNYANPSVYGAVRKSNSNSFAGHIARECGLTRPDKIAKARGWNRPPAAPEPGREKLQSPCKLPGGN